MYETLKYFIRCFKSLEFELGAFSTAGKYPNHFLAIARWKVEDDLKTDVLHLCVIETSATNNRIKKSGKHTDNREKA